MLIRVTNFQLPALCYFALQRFLHHYVFPSQRRHFPHNLRVPFAHVRTRGKKKKKKPFLTFRANRTRSACSERGGAWSPVDQSHADAAHLTFYLCIERHLKGESSQPELFQEGNLKSVFRYIYIRIYIYMYTYITIYVVLSIHIHFSGRRT